MPFAFIIVGLVLVISGVRGTGTQLLALIKGEFQGKDNYLYWAVAILAIGAVGYVPSLRPLSRAFLVLVLIVLVLKTGKTSNTGGGFFKQFTTALQQISQPNTAANTGASLASN